MSRPRKNNADYFPHDNNLRHDRRILALRNKFGVQGYGVYSMFLEILTAQDDFKIRLDDVEFELLAGELGMNQDAAACGNLRQIFTEMIKLRLLQQDGDWYWSEELTDRLSTFVKKRDRERERAQERPREERGKFINSLREDKPKKVVSAADCPQSKVKESKLKENIKRKDYNFFDDNEFTELYDSFLEMRKQKKKPATDFAEELILIKLHKQSLINAKLMLKKSITNSYTDVYEPQEQDKSSPQISQDNKLWKELTDQCGKCKNGMIDKQNEYGMWVQAYCNCISSLRNKKKVEELII